MITVPALVRAVGATLLQLVVEGTGSGVDDVVLAEPDGDVGVPGDLVLGIGVTDPSRAVVLIRRIGQAGAGGVVLKSPVARDLRVVATAERLGLAVVELQTHTSWTHVVWLLRGVIDRAAAPGSPMVGDAGVHGELFAIADAAAAIVDAPVTIEDPQSRVLAYSARQELTDPVRVSTIVGRRVPEKIIAHFRARGVFRQLARSDEPIYVSEGPDGTLPRLVVPVRAGAEWLGSIWAAVPGPVAPDRVGELRRAASVLALHLLRLRAQVDLSRRVSTDRIRAVLQGAAPEPEPSPGFPDGPWRVAALGAPAATGDAGGNLDLWESISRRFGWHQPLLADLDGIVFAVVTDRESSRMTGSRGWLRDLVASLHPRDVALTVAVGGTAVDRADLPRSRAEAAELCRLLATGDLEGPIVQLEEVWYTVTIARARAAVRAEAGLLGGPVPALVDHDQEHGTTFIRTLAAWLDHPGDPRTAAADLHVHPNTLRHRMKRISEVAAVNLTEPDVRLALRLQLAALADGAAQGR